MVRKKVRTRFFTYGKIGNDPLPYFGKKDTV